MRTVSSSTPSIQPKAGAKLRPAAFRLAWGKGILLPVTLVLLWQLVGSFELISKTVLPAPFDILITCRDLTVSGELFTHLGISIQRAALGFCLGAGLGLLLGLVIGFSKIAEDYLDPSLQMLRTVPHLAVTPLFILWFGFDELSKVLLIALGAFFPVYINHIFRDQGRRFETVRCGESIGVPLAEAGDKADSSRIAPKHPLRHPPVARCFVAGPCCCRADGIKRRSRLYDYGCQTVFTNR